MSETCPNCGKPVLPTDTVCWHCGFALPKRARAKAAGPAPAAARGGRSSRNDRRAAATDETADYDLRALAVYGLLTLVVILGLWLVMRALGREPILVRSAALAGGDWVTVTDADLRYTLSLPSDWQWLDVAYRDQSDLLAQLVASQPYIGRALAPLGAPAGDVEILAVAAGMSAPLAADTSDPVAAGTPDPAAAPIPFVVIGRSQRLRVLEAQDALDLLGGQGLSVSEAAVDTHLAGQTQARFKVFDAANAYQCRHLFVADGDTYGYLVAACAPQAAYGSLQQQLDDLLDTFQLLVN